MGEQFEELRRLLALTYSTASVEAVAREIAGGAPAGIEHRRNVGDMLETLAAIGEHTEQVLAALDAETARADAAEAEVARLREALTDIGVYGCGMLNQPIAINGPEEAWLRKRIAEYERRARAALSPKKGSET